MKCLNVIEVIFVYYKKYCSPVLEDVDHLMIIELFENRKIGVKELCFVLLHTVVGLLVQPNWESFLITGCMKDLCKYNIEAWLGFNTLVSNKRRPKANEVRDNKYSWKIKWNATEFWEGVCWYRFYQAFGSPN